MRVIIGYLTIVNITGFILFGIDKRRARRGAWRIPEKTLFFVAVIGGSAGAILGMRVFRHKTKHMRFIIGMPMILILQIALIFFAYTKGLI